MSVFRVFWLVFSRIRTEYGEIWSISIYSFEIRENTNQENSENGYFTRSVIPPEVHFIQFLNFRVLCYLRLMSNTNKRKVRRENTILLLLFSVFLVNFYWALLNFSLLLVPLFKIKITKSKPLNPVEHDDRPMIWWSLLYMFDWVLKRHWSYLFPKYNLLKTPKDFHMWIVSSLLPYIHSFFNKTHTAMIITPITRRH